MSAPPVIRELPAIPFELVPITPLPETREVGWAEWDAAVRALDESSPEGRARRLAEHDEQRIRAAS